MAEIKRDLIATVADSARVSPRVLSVSFKKSPSALTYLIQTYVKSDYLVCPHAVVDYSFFGLILFRVYFKSGYVSEADKEVILTTLRSRSSVTSIYELSGEFDLVAEFECPNSSRFNKELRSIISAHPTLNNYKVVLNIVTHLMPHEYLTSAAAKQIVVGGDRPVEQFDDISKSILQYLITSPLSSIREISRQTGHHTLTVKKVLVKLEDKKILRGYKYALNAMELGITKVRIFLRFHNTNVDRDQGLHQFISQTPEIVQYNKTIGDWDMELDIESLQKQTIRQVIMRLRAEFKDIIQTFNSIEFYKHYKKTYLPLTF